MYGDFSRYTLNPDTEYTRVLLQQGRPLTDADLNEQTALMIHMQRQFIADMMGGSGTFDGGFQISNIDDSVHDGSFQIQSGHFYAAGLRIALTRHSEDRSEWQIPLDNPKAPYVARKIDRNGKLILEAWEETVHPLEQCRITDPAFDDHWPSFRSSVRWRICVVDETSDAIEKSNCPPSITVQAAATAEIQSQQAAYYVLQVAEKNDSSLVLKWAQDSGCRVVESTNPKDDPDLWYEHFPTADVAIPGGSSDSHKRSDSGSSDHCKLTGETFLASNIIRDTAFFMRWNKFTKANYQLITESPQEVVDLQKRKKLEISLPSGIEVTFPETQNFRAGDFWVIRVVNGKIDVNGMPVKSVEKLQVFPSAFHLVRVCLGEIGNGLICPDSGLHLRTCAPAKSEKTCEMVTESSDATPAEEAGEAKPMPPPPDMPERMERETTPTASSFLSPAGQKQLQDYFSSPEDVLRQVWARNLLFVPQSAAFNKWYTLVTVSELVGASVEPLLARIKKSMADSHDPWEAIEADAREAFRIANQFAETIRLGDSRNDGESSESNISIAQEGVSNDDT